MVAVGQLSNQFGQGEDDDSEFELSLPGEQHEPDRDGELPLDGPPAADAPPEDAAPAETGDDAPPGGEAPVAGGHPGSVVGDDAGPDGDAEEILFDLSDWSEIARDGLTDRLREAGVPHWWVEGELHGSAEDAGTIDGLIDAVENEEAEALDPDVDQVAYDMSEWDDDRIETLAERLEAAEIPYGWSGDELFVYARDESVVDDIFDAVEHPDEIDAEPDEVPAEDVEGTLLGELFVASDRIQHDPKEHEPVATLLLLADKVEKGGPPYGLSAGDWGHLRERVVVLADLLCEDDRDEEAVVTAARDLRTSLRSYV